MNFESAYVWLNFFYRHSHAPARDLMAKLLVATSQGQDDTVVTLIKGIKRFARDLRQPASSGELMATAGYAARKLGALEPAHAYLGMAHEYFHFSKDWHKVALTQWMLGWVCWELPGGESCAMTAWGESLRLMNRLATRHKINYASWYPPKIVMMQKTWEEQVEKNVAPVLPVGVVTPAPQRLAQPQLGTEWRIAMVMHEVSAGTGSLLSGIKSTVTVSQIQIDGCACSVHPLVEQSMMNVFGRRGNKSFLQVSGNSMNQSGIENGDYVLLVQGELPVHQNIVAVTLKDEEHAMTLKRWIKDGDKIFLCPESDDPAFHERVFADDDVVVGVVVAYFKPLPN